MCIIRKKKMRVFLLSKDPNNSSQESDSFPVV